MRGRENQLKTATKALLFLFLIDWLNLSQIQTIRSQGALNTSWEDVPTWG